MAPSSWARTNPAARSWAATSMSGRCALGGRGKVTRSAECGVRNAELTAPTLVSPTPHSAPRTPHAVISSSTTSCTVSTFTSSPHFTQYGVPIRAHNNRRKS